ncbi:hypothetical protein OQA88_11536 [Cercophora sp. LCS_1]
MVLPPALIETWVLYSVGSLIILARIVCRWRLVGLYNFKPDDYLIVCAWMTYTAMTVAAHIVGSNGDLHSLTPQQRYQLSLLPPEFAEQYIMGTRWFSAGVVTYITFIWLLKINMLFLYQRVVNGLWVEKFIMPTMGLVVLTYLSLIMVLFLPCRPYSRILIIWPDQGEYCKPQSFLNMVPPLVMNLVTDVFIMAIPAPVILPVRTTIWRKIGLIFLFFAGFFIMTAAVLRVVFVLVVRDGPTAAIWSCREDIVAIIVGQAILIRPIFTRNFWSRNFGDPTRQKVVVRQKGPSWSLERMRRGFRRNDPFSVTAALADDRSGVESMRSNGSDKWRGKPGSNSRSLVISVSTEVDIDNAESPADDERGKDYLTATNKAQCWKGCDEEGQRT